jgi:hypothetical protein
MKKVKTRYERLRLMAAVIDGIPEERLYNGTHMFSHDHTKDLFGSGASPLGWFARSPLGRKYGLRFEKPGTLGQGTIRFRGTALDDYEELGDACEFFVAAEALKISTDEARWLLEPRAYCNDLDWRIEAFTGQKIAGMDSKRVFRLRVRIFLQLAGEELENGR